MQKNNYLYTVIHLTKKSLSKLYQMNCALKMPISPHWLQKQFEMADSDTDTKREELHSHFPLVISLSLLLPF